MICFKTKQRYWVAASYDIEETHPIEASHRRKKNPPLTRRSNHWCLRGKYISVYIYNCVLVGNEIQGVNAWLHIYFNYRNHFKCTVTKSKVRWLIKNTLIIIIPIVIIILAFTWVHSENFFSLLYIFEIIRKQITH